MAYTTLTSVVPHYTTVTESGEVHTETLTSTDTIVTTVPHTIAETVYTTSYTTDYATTDVYATESYVVTAYTTVVEVSFQTLPK